MQDADTELAKTQSTEDTIVRTPNTLQMSCEASIVDLTITVRQTLISGKPLLDHGIYERTPLINMSLEIAACNHRALETE